MVVIVGVILLRISFGRIPSKGNSCPQTSCTQFSFTLRVRHNESDWLFRVHYAFKGILNSLHSIRPTHSDGPYLFLSYYYFYYYLIVLACLGLNSKRDCYFKWIRSFGLESFIITPSICIWMFASWSHITSKIDDCLLQMTHFCSIVDGVDRWTIRTGCTSH